MAISSSQPAANHMPGQPSTLSPPAGPDAQEDTQNSGQSLGQSQQKDEIQTLDPW